MSFIILVVIFTQVNGISTIVSKNSESVKTLTQTCERLADKIDIIKIEQENAHVIQQAIQQMPVPQILPEELVCLIETDMRGRIIKCSDGVFEIFGYTPEEVINRNVKLFMDEDMGVEHDVIFTENSISDGPICDRDIIAYGKNNKKVNVQLSVSRYTGKFGPRYLVTIKG
jgi:PAS domain S-box-containing protein